LVRVNFDVILSSRLARRRGGSGNRPPACCCAQARKRLSQAARFGVKAKKLAFTYQKGIVFAAARALQDWRPTAWRRRIAAAPR
jgi:hypothetical protein